MIAYFDTSAIVPLLVHEDGSAAAGELWDRAVRVLTVRLALVEARAALAQAARMRRISGAQLRTSVRELDGLVDQAELVEVDDDLVRRAAGLAESHELRAYDAVHLAAALTAADDDLVLVAGDLALVAAAEAAGLATAVVG